MDNNKKVIGLFIIFIYICNFTSAATQSDTGVSYIEALAQVRDQVQTSEQNIIKDVDSFSAAFKDTFKLIDDEISRLIFANAAMVGLVFAIMFLVYAKTSSRTRRDMQVMLVAHSKHLDSVMSSRLDEFTRKIELMLEEKRKEDLSTLESLDDQIKDLRSLPDMTDLDRKDRKPETSLEVVSKSRGIRDVMKVEEPQKDVDGKVLVPKIPSSPGSKFFRRIKLGMQRMMGMRKNKEKVDEFKIK